MRRLVGHVTWHRVALVLALVAVALITYHPHHNWATGREYRFPVHMDEYVHWGYSQAVVEQGTATFRNPFTGHEPDGFNVDDHLHERGYHAYLGTFSAVTGLDLLTMFHWGPMLIAMFLALCVYALAERWLPWAGIAAAVWIACIPTSLRFLGPGYMVPIIFSLPLVTLGLFTLFHTRRGGGLAVFAILAAALWPIHVIGAFGLFAFGALYGLLLLPGHTWRGLCILAMGALPFLASWDFYDRLLETGVLVIPHHPAAESIILWYGAAPLLLATIGTTYLMLRHRGTDAAAGATLGLAVLLSDAVILWRLFYNEDPFILYDRIYMLLFLTASILGGIGIAWIGNTLWTHARAHNDRHHGTMPLRRLPVGIVVALLIIPLFAVPASAKVQMERETYVVLTERQYERYTAAAELLRPEHQKAAVEGISTMAWTILAGTPTTYWRAPWSPGVDPEPWPRFYSGGSHDTLLLVKTGTTVVVTDKRVDNPDLRPLVPGVYVLRDDYASRMHAK